ncbi:hypothetical protein [Paraburkholderia sp. BCC1885]|uniref:hypothetical protein n=1 Tax=Paraburkholderia sp. BCC1885 TaxID=2562669 RepID=UPI0011840C79|nr:hypothetical protein [Paraburkholderia sp. BCC1885]
MKVIEAKSKSKDVDSKPTVKLVGASGQISLGKEYAGRTVQLEQRGPGEWLVRTVRIIPDNEAWLHTAEALADLTEAVAWEAKNRPRKSDPQAVYEELMNGGKQGK